VKGVYFLRAFAGGSRMFWECNDGVGGCMRTTGFSLERLKMVKQAICRRLHGVMAVKVLENDQWVEQQFGDCELGDARRVDRLNYMAKRMLNCPEASIPTQNARWSDVKAAYRFFDCPDVTFEAVAENHWQQTRQTKPGRYLLLGDTTDIDHFNHRATTGLSQLGKGTGRGMQLHSCLMVDAANESIVGLAGALLQYRPIVSKTETRMQRLSRSRESEKWGRVVDEVGSPPPGAQWIHVFDREGDQFEAMCYLVLNQCDWVIRVSKLARKVQAADSSLIPLSKAIEPARVLGTYELNLRSRPGQPARAAKIRVSTTEVTLPKPRHASPFLKQCEVSSISANIVVVEEYDAPKGITPIKWVLQTSLPIETFDDAWQVIGYYEMRWLIEEYHKVIKTGCSIERHALRTAERLEPLIGLIRVIGIRLLELKTIAKRDPATKAENRIPASWLKALKAIRNQILLATLTVKEFFRELAKIGGFLGRKHDGEPGWQTLWRGYHKLHMILIGINSVQRTK
jgi:hypothetical protein